MTADRICTRPGVPARWWEPDLVTGLDLANDAPEWEAPRAWCQACPARVDCLAQILVAEQGIAPEERTGMVGGHTGKERVVLLRNARRREARRLAREAAAA